MELWDALYKDGSKAGFDLVRDKDIIPEGIYHLVCEVLVRHVDGSYLLMQRDYNKKGWPGKWESTAGGSALKGESALDCIKRELFEETGIKANNFVKINSSTNADNRSLYYEYFLVTNVEKNSIVLQQSETIDYKWLSKEEFRKFIKTDDFVNTTSTRIEEFMQNELSIKLIGCCGLDCKECQIYNATLSNDIALKEKIAKDISSNDLSFTIDNIYCLGCTSSKPFKSMVENCEIYNCNNQNKINSCSLCHQFPCNVYNKYNSKDSNNRNNISLLIKEQTNEKED